MASTIIIGDGPAGLSAALFLAKNDHDVRLLGLDGTAMHHAHLHNYLGVPDTGGSDFQSVARRQVAEQGVDVEEVEVTGVGVADGGGFEVRMGEDTATCTSLVVAGGKATAALVESLGVEVTPDGVDTDRDGRTSVDGLYVVGRVAKPNRSQAIISAGVGGAAAIDILSREAGEDVMDWDSPPKDDG